MYNIIQLNEIEYPLSEVCDFLYATLPLNIFIVNQGGYTVWANQRTLTAIGLTSLEDFLNIHISHWGEDKWYFCKEAMDTCKEIAMEEQTDDKRGYYWTIRKPIIKNNKIQGVLGVSLDITERKQAEIAKTQFIENITHDIRTPLTGMIGVAQLMQADSEDSSVCSYPMYADMLVESANALYNFLSQVIASVKVSAGERITTLQLCPLSDFLEEIEKLHQLTAIQKGLEFIVEKDPALPPHIIGDSLRIKSILLELVSNAMKYTSQGFVKCRFQFENQNEPSMLILRVEDTGIGIPEDKHQEIFNKFTRVNKAQAGIYTGSGLGLSNVKQLLQDLNAEIRVESTLGVGSVFTCYVPVQLPAV